MIAFKKFGPALILSLLTACGGTANVVSTPASNKDKTQIPPTDDLEAMASRCDGAVPGSSTQRDACTTAAQAFESAGLPATARRYFDRACVVKSDDARWAACNGVARLFRKLGKPLVARDRWTTMQEEGCRTLEFKTAFGRSLLEDAPINEDRGVALLDESCRASVGTSNAAHREACELMAERGDSHAEMEIARLDRIAEREEERQRAQTEKEAREARIEKQTQACYDRCESQRSACGSRCTSASFAAGSVQTSCFDACSASDCIDACAAHEEMLIAQSERRDPEPRTKRADRDFERDEDAPVSSNVGDAISDALAQAQRDLQRSNEERQRIIDSGFGRTSVSNPSSSDSSPSRKSAERADDKKKCCASAWCTEQWNKGRALCAERFAGAYKPIGKGFDTSQVNPNLACLSANSDKQRRCFSCCGRPASECNGSAYCWGG